MFSKEWEQTYKAGRHNVTWPWTDVICLVKGRVVPLLKKKSGNISILELGCGAGANIGFFKQLGWDYHAIEGSQTVVSALRETNPEFADKILVGDFTEEIPFDRKFNLILDRASLTHNPTSSIRTSLKMIHEKLEDDGFYVGLDWFTTNHSDYTKGKPVEDDPYSRVDLQDSQFEGVGLVHFTNQKLIHDLFSDFEITIFREKTLKYMIPENDHILATYDIVARKK